MKPIDKTKMARSPSHRLSVAPMMDWTDRHCRRFHRVLSAQTLLYTEMVTAPALVRGDARHLLDFTPEEQPVAVQLGGSNPAELAQATAMSCDAGYSEINLNVGCPSDRVQSGCFGAVLMERPELVGDCVAAMLARASVPVTVKCRIGVDEQDPAETLPLFLSTIRAAGVERVIIHARKAWLQGLSPKQNREIPPLDYPLVRQMKREFPDLHISINGGVTSLEQVVQHLQDGIDGVMIGRAAYHSPADILLEADRRVFGADDLPKTPIEAVHEMRPYVEDELARGTRLHAITRHMLGLFSGRPGARKWRQVLSSQATRPGVGWEVVDAALAGLGAAPVDRAG